MAEERTERPTPRRLQEARRRGQVARSRELTQAVQLGAVLLALVYLGEWLLRGVQSDAVRGLVRMGLDSHRTLAPSELTALVIAELQMLGSIVGPIALTAGVATVGGACLQGGWVWAGEALRLRWEALNPSNGLRRLGWKQAGIELVKVLVAATLVGWICWGVVGDVLADADRYGLMVPTGAGGAGWYEIQRLLGRCALAMLVLSGGDYAVQRWRVLDSLRMTRQEVRDDHRLAEGNPEVKARIRRIQREQARKRMLAAVPRATVVITNPTEYAVALEYRRAVMAAPVVVAKGRGFLAARIRAIAREHGVPMFENVPLAQALYRGTQVGEAIPGDLFEAVAEVLAYLIRLRQLAL